MRHDSDRCPAKPATIDDACMIELIANDDVTNPGKGFEDSVGCGAFRWHHDGRLNSQTKAQRPFELLLKDARPDIVGPYPYRSRASCPAATTRGCSARPR
jgi:hypothetical protein